MCVCLCNDLSSACCSTSRGCYGCMRVYIMVMLRGCMCVCVCVNKDLSSACCSPTKKSLPQCTQSAHIPVLLPPTASTQTHRKTWDTLRYEDTICESQKCSRTNESGETDRRQLLWNKSHLWNKRHGHLM